jgi:signal transduction histidine kinase
MAGMQGGMVHFYRPVWRRQVFAPIAIRTRRAHCIRIELANLPRTMETYETSTARSEQSVSTGLSGTGSASVVNSLRTAHREDKLLALEAAISSLGQKLRRARNDTQALERLNDPEFARRVAGLSRLAAVGLDALELVRRRLTALEDDWESERKLHSELEAETSTLKEINQQLNAFGYSVAHDLSAPLRTIKGFAQLLLEQHGTELGASGGELAQRIVKASDRLERLVADLLAYSRTTNAELTRVPINLDEVLGEVVVSLHQDIQQQRAALEVKKPLGFVLAHPQIVAQILSNLIGNALKFVAPGQAPQVRVSSIQHGDRVRLEVRDNGIGIPAKHHEAIFQLFGRLHSPRVHPGAGLGLAVVRKGVQRMGGSVGVESRPGEGSLFWVELPAAEQFVEH